MTTEREITDQQQHFVERYTIHFNATRAAKEAGYSEKSAARQAHDLLNNPLVQKEIESIIAATKKRHERLRYRVVKQLELLAFSNIKDYGSYDKAGLNLKSSDELDDDLASAVREIKVTTQSFGKHGENSTTTINFKLESKEKALELLGRHLGMFNEDPEADKKKEPRKFVLAYQVKKKGSDAA